MSVYLNTQERLDLLNELGLGKMPELLGPADIKRLDRKDVIDLTLLEKDLKAWVDLRRGLE